MPRCKKCKQKFEAKFFNQKFCKSNNDCLTAEAMHLLEQKKKADKKNWQKEKREKLPILYPRKYKNLLQSQINLLARKIDAHFGYLCIDCGKPYGKQVDAAHLHNSQGNENIRFNLHNLHSAKSDCNQWSSEHKVGYRNGIIERYGKDYLNYIDIELPKIYSYIGLKENEVTEKLAIVRKINREFDKIIEELNLNSIELRDYFNKKIGIYKKRY